MAKKMIQTHINEISEELMYRDKTIIIHKTAIVSDKAVIKDGVKIGPYCIVGDNVELGVGVILHSHVIIDGITIIGDNTTIFPFAAIGFPPQDLKYAGERSRVLIGNNNIIREHVTIHSGTKVGRMETTIGDSCLMMVGSHVAHDCIVGDNVVMANNATLGGHVVIANNVIIGGLAAVHQFVRIGEYAIIGGVSGVTSDIIPYASAVGDRAKLLGVNTRGLRRNGFLKEDIKSIHLAYDILFKPSEKHFAAKLQKIEEDFKDNKKVLAIVGFIKANKVRPICTT